MQKIKSSTKRTKQWSLPQGNPPIWLYDKVDELYKCGKVEKAIQFAHKVFTLYPKHEKLWITYLDILFWGNHIPKLLK